MDSLSPDGPPVNPDRPKKKLRPRKNLLGQVFGAYRVDEYLGCLPHKSGVWLCRCTGCGGERRFFIGQLQPGFDHTCPVCTPPAVEAPVVDERTAIIEKRRQHQAFQRQRTQERKERGVCVACGIERPGEGKVTCDRCLTRSRNNARANAEAGLCYCGRERVRGYTTCLSCLENARLQRAKRRAEGLCNCGRGTEPGHNTCDVCRDRNNERRRLLKAEVVAAYGGACACCGETLTDMLEVDHICGDGGQDRKRGFHGGVKFYGWLKRHGWPGGFQILCSGCNKAKGKGVECPHQARQRAMLASLAPLPLTY